jgi:hypothetical protein
VSPQGGTCSSTHGAFPVSGADRTVAHVNEHGQAATTFPRSSRRRAADGRLTPSERSIVALMGAVATSLAVMSGLHLSGTLGGGTRPFDPSAAGIAEAVICLVLGYGTIRFLRQQPGAHAVALATTGFAIIGFLIGLGFTLGGGGAIDIAYHLSVLPILLVALIALVRTRARNTPPPSAGGVPNQGAGS